jgi:hypothetical protein
MESYGFPWQIGSKIQSGKCNSTLSFKEKTLFTICKGPKQSMQILNFKPGVYLLLRWKPDFIIWRIQTHAETIFIFFYCKLFSKKYYGGELVR